MATLQQLQSSPTAAPADDAPGADLAPGMGAAPPDDQQGADPTAKVDGGDPKHMVGWIDPRLPAKVRVFLKAAAQFIIRTPSPEAANLRLKKVLRSAGDHIKALAYYTEKVIQQLENKLGPLSDKEHDQVAFFIVGWLVSTMQAWGMPGLDDANARQHMIGQILQALDGMTKAPPGQQDPNAPPADPAAADAPPVPGAPQPPPGVPAPQGGTLPQLAG